MEADRRYSSRKFVTVWVWAVVWTVLIYAAKIPPEIYKDLMWLSVGGYLLADVAEKYFVSPEKR
jgi:hypothetical protein